MSLLERIKTQAQNLPTEAGVYQFCNKADTIIYVGKAKNLRKRVSSYFTKKHDSVKTAIMVRNVASIRYVAVETEQDALLLENNLIKKYLPRYNVLLKDDKSFPWICIKNEPFPRVFMTRTIQRDNSEYFGPYTSVFIARTLIRLIKESFTLRTCKHLLSPENVAAKKFRLCLEYHIHNCQGGCQGLQSEENYREDIEQVRKILKGNLREVIGLLRQRMITYSDRLQYEEAGKVKQQMEALQRYQSRSTIVSPKLNNIEVYSFEDDIQAQTAYVNFLKVVRGAVVQVHTLELKRKIDEPPHELLALAIVEMRTRLDSHSVECIVPFDPQIALEGVRFIVPMKGEKKHLLELSHRNAKLFRLEMQKRASERAKEPRSAKLLRQVQRDLRMQVLPSHIECFDNSNLQGTNPVASCIVFRDGKPAKKEYRKFNVKTVTGANDFASMTEIVHRRYRRLMDEEQELPQLIIVDGGKGQLSSALKALEELGVERQTTLIGIAKRLEEIYYPKDSVPLYLDKTSETLKLIQRLRDEAHRFGVSFHRQKRSKNMFQSELHGIEGIGEKTIERLLQKFSSVQQLKNMPYEEIAQVIGKAKATLICRALKGS